jgi:4-amino-4-deoxy-L-arabinose transferase-like glycosyltransferase
MEDTHGESSSRRAFWVVLSIATVARVVLASVVPLSGDEAYYWDCSRHLDWSYFDQPPLAIWSMIPFRMLLGETSLAVRMPAILASLAIGLCLPPLARRLGGGYREATHAYLWMCAMPLFLLGSFYASTDILVSALFVATTWSAVALAQGERHAWWGFGVSIGLAILAKFPGVLALAAVVPALFNPDVRRQFGTWTPWLAALAGLALTVPIWIWGGQHDWANFTFQLRGRHDIEPLGAKHLAEFVGANMLLATPALFVAIAIAWWRGFRRADLAWKAIAVAAAAPFVVFGIVSLRARVGAHWGGPGLVLGALMLALAPAARPRRALAIVSGAIGGLVALLVLVIVLAPTPLLRMDWSDLGRLERIRTKVLHPIVGNDEVVREIELIRRADEIVASESYTVVHLFGFLSNGRLPMLLGDVVNGEHGLGSLYWHTPDSLRGRNVLFVTQHPGEWIARLAPYFDHVEEIAPVEVRRDGEVVRRFRVFRCGNLLRPEQAFSRL